MAEEVRVWVKTSVIEEVLYGKAKTSSNRRSLPDTLSIPDNNGVCNWGWARATRIRDSGDAKSSNAVKVYINDEESEYNRQSIEIPAEKAKEGVVMDNIWEEDEESDGDRFDSGVKVGPPDDLIHLTHLHEPAVVHCLRRRYDADKIYTATGPILLALNPFKNVKSLYSSKIRQQYVDRGEKSALLGASSDGDGEVDPLPPHVYALADHSFRALMKQFEEAASGTHRGRASPGDHGCDQSILVSESGAGKTVTTKFIMQYLASLSERSSGRSKRTVSDRRPSDDSRDQQGATTTEQQVLQSNPILESFGNARTIRNDNSSRFGKFIELAFTNSGMLIGASVETYLLEKVRLVHQMPGERNYHIFYELLVGLDDSELEKYHLVDLTAQDFRMTNASGTYDRRDGVDDYDTYTDLLRAMNMMGFSKDEQESIFTVTCALLHCSNLEFNAISADESEIDFDSPSLEPILSLLGFTADALNRALCYFSIQAGRERHTRSLPKDRAAKGLEGLIKATYGALFTHIVNRVNSSIHVKDSGGGRGLSRGPSKKAKIGVLDIFGFESFKRNSFEQLCINYCNEALQQQFNLFVLKNEQDEYEREGIQWSFITFPDNQDVLDLIWKKGSGILNILDDQCRAPGTTDKTFSTDIYKKCTGHPRFEADFRQVGSRLFGIVHYAGSVEYDTEGFVEKNRDEVPREATDLLQSSSNELVRLLGEIISFGTATPPATSPTAVRRTTSSVSSVSNRGGPRSSNTARQTVGSQFSQQLLELRQKIDLTSPHYVRCLKPNDVLIPDHFDPVIIAHQLRCAGVIEAVRVSRVGYPQRYSHANFVKRYKVVALKELKQSTRSSRQLKPCDALVYAIAKRLQQMDPLLKPNEGRSSDDVDFLKVGLQVGKTKVFLRAHAYELIEQLRHESMDKAAIKIQEVGRMRIDRKDFLLLRKGCVGLQCATRKMIAETAVGEFRMNHRSTIIQCIWRMIVCKQRFIATSLVTRWAQRTQRGLKARALYSHLNQERKARILQQWWRTASRRRSYQAERRSCLALQCAYRCAVSRRELKALKTQQRDLSAVGHERDMLRVEVQKLRSELEQSQQKLKQFSEQSASASSAEVAVLRKENEEIRLQLNGAQSSAQRESERAIDALRAVDNVAKDLEKSLTENKVLKRELEKSKSAISVGEEKLRNLEESSVEQRKQLNALQRENIDLAKRNQELENQLVAMSEEAVEASAAQAASANAIHEEVQRLRDELVDVREQLHEYQMKDDEPVSNGFSPHEIDALREEAQSLQEELANAKMHTAKALRESDMKLNKAYEEIFALKTHLVAANRKVEELESNAAKLKPGLESPATAIPIPGGESFGEVEYLQNEILRLEQELQEAKNAASAPTTSPAIDYAKVAFDPNSPEHLLSRYEELRKLSEANIVKEREIELLRKENGQLRQELDIHSKQLTETEFPIEADETSSLGFSDAADGNRAKSDSDPFFTFRRKKSQPNILGSPSKEEDAALRAVNEMLRCEVETLHKKLEEAEKQAAEEKKRAADDLEAFSEALRGVDQMRRAAESMSRELGRHRRREKFSKITSGKWESMSVRDDVSYMSGGTEMFQEAKVILEKSNKQAQNTQNLWGKVRSNMLGHGRDDHSYK